MANNFNNPLFIEVVKRFLNITFDITLISCTEKPDIEAFELVFKTPENNHFSVLVSKDFLADQGLGAVTRSVQEVLNRDLSFDLKKFDDEDWIKLMNLPVEEMKKLIEALKRA